MDRLVIESALSDVNELLLSDVKDAGSGPSVILIFKAVNEHPVAHAFAELKKIAANHTIELTICKTLVNGIYDLEIKTEGLDEPLRIMNKAVSTETLGVIEDHLNKDQSILLGTDLLEREGWIIVKTACIKDCDIRH